MYVIKKRSSRFVFLSMERTSRRVPSSSNLSARPCACERVAVPLVPHNPPKEFQAASTGTFPQLPASVLSVVSVSPVLILDVPSRPTCPKTPQTLRHFHISMSERLKTLG